MTNKRMYTWTPDVNVHLVDGEIDGVLIEDLDSTRYKGEYVSEFIGPHDNDVPAPAVAKAMIAAITGGGSVVDLDLMYRKARAFDQILAGMAAEEDWSADTLDFIANTAKNHDLAHTDSEGMFAVGVEPEVATYILTVHYDVQATSEELAREAWESGELLGATLTSVELKGNLK